MFSVHSPRLVIVMLVLSETRLALSSKQVRSDTRVALPSRQVLSDIRVVLPSRHSSNHSSTIRKSIFINNIRTDLLHCIPLATSSVVTNKQEISLRLNHWSVADPGFRRRGAIPQGKGASLLFGLIFLENCLKVKKLDPEGQRASLKSANVDRNVIQFSFTHSKRVSTIFPWRTSRPGLKEDRHLSHLRFSYKFINDVEMFAVVPKTFGYSFHSSIWYLKYFQVC